MGESVTSAGAPVPAASPPAVQAERLVALLPDWAVAPRYDGYGTAAVPNTILAHFGVAQPLAPLPPGLLPPGLLAGSRVVILLLIDALGFDALARGLAVGACPNLAAALAAGRMTLSALTTIFPSTTAAALTTYATGESPSRHGMAGYTLWLDEVAAVVNMIRFTPVSGHGSAPRPEHFLPLPTVFERLAAAGVTSSYVNLRPLLTSGLSLMHGKGATSVAALSFADLCCAVRQRLDATRGERHYIQAYWDAVDGIAHQRGPRAVALDAELAAIDFSLGRELFDAVRQPDVTLLIAADHGQTETNPARALRLEREPDLMRLLARPPTGERRAVYLAAKAESRGALDAWVADRIGPDGALLTVDAALAAGLWGPAPYDDRFVSRLGTHLLLPAPGMQFPYHGRRDGDEPTLPIGAHGSLTRDEAVVPLLATRLG